MITRAPWLPWMGLLVLWTGAFMAACRLLQQPLLQADQQLSVWASLLSSGRTELSHSLYGRANVYFHCGVEEIEHVAFPNRFDRWFKIVAPTEHRHAEDTKSLETMPWLRWATQLDPQNVTAWQDAAYAADYVKDTELSLKILAEALRLNPRDDRIYAQRGLLLLRHHSYEKAATDFDRALRLLPARPEPDAVVLRQDAIATLKNKALCDEMLEHRDLAIAHLQQCLQLDPDRPATRAWLAQLENGCNLRADAEQRLRGLEAAERNIDPDDRHEQAKP